MDVTEVNCATGETRVRPFTPAEKAAHDAIPPYVEPEVVSVEDRLAAVERTLVAKSIATDAELTQARTVERPVIRRTVTS